jgi:hypothetical protein
MSTAPPIGLTPKWVRDLQRANEIMEAMQRYIDARKPIPQAWIDELIEVAGEKPNAKTV